MPAPLLIKVGEKAPAAEKLPGRRKAPLFKAVGRRKSPPSKASWGEETKPAFKSQLGERSRAPAKKGRGEKPLRSGETDFCLNDKYPLAADKGRGIKLGPFAKMPLENCTINYGLSKAFLRPGPRPFQSAGIRNSIRPFCACRRFSAWSKITEAGLSSTSSVTSSPGWAGRQWRKIAPGSARAMS